MRFPRSVPTFATFFAVLATIPLAALPARAAQAPGAMIVLDGSGSMWGELARQTPKVDALRASLAQALGRTDKTARLGLMSFGHRRKADCQDVELIVPIEPGSATEIAGQLAKFSPTGKGPISLALREAAKAAAGQSVSTLILVHDGLDNCQQDACAAAAEIAKTYPGLNIHTIGLALEPQVAQKNACIARATGGKAFEARDPATLAAAVDQAFELARLLPGPGGAADAAAPKPRPATPEMAATTGPPRIRLTAHLGQVETPITTPVTWTLRDPREGKVVSAGTAAEFSRAMAPGTYVVEARLGLATSRREVTVAEKGVTAARVAFDAGVVDVKVASSGADATARDLVLSIAPADEAGGVDAAASGERQWIGRHARVELVLPAGRYRARATEGLARQEQEVTVSAGNVATVEMALQSGRLELATAEQEGGAPADGVFYTLAVDDPTTSGGRREIARTLASQPSFTLSAGTYYVTSRLGAAEARERIAVGAGAVVSKTLVLPVARIAVSASLKLTPAPELPLSYRIQYLDGEVPTEVARDLSPRAEFVLAPGKYRIDASAGAQNATASQVVTLAAGTRKDIAMGIEASQVTLKLGGGIPPAPDAFWEVRDASDRPIWRTTRAAPQGFLAPGRYRVRFESRDRRLEATVELAAGEERTVELGAE